MNKDLMFSRKSDEWETPLKLFNTLDEEFDFVLDLAATEHNTKCFAFSSDIDKADLSIWNDGWMWCNPPYSKCKEFVKLVSDNNVNCVMLIPSRTDTKWFHDYIYNRTNVEIRFLKGRLKFSGHKNNAPFPSMIVIFKRID